MEQVLQGDFQIGIINAFGDGPSMGVPRRPPAGLKG